MAHHYDELGPFYRHLWGDHLHHGYWEDEDDPSSIAEATERLLEIITSPLALRPDQRVIDIGCGYGAPARWLAMNFGARVTGLTISPHQATIAQTERPPARGRVEIHCRDWLQNNLAEHSFDAALAIESLAHIPDKAAFFREVARTLKPGAPAAIACWMAAPDLALLERILLKQLCRDGRLSGIGTTAEYHALAASSGLHLTNHHDLTTHVAPTWQLLARRTIISLFTRPTFLLATLRQILRRPSQAFTIPLMILAYHLGALRYGILWFECPTVRKQMGIC